MTEQEIEALAILGEETLELSIEFDLGNVEELQKEAADLLVAISLFKGTATFDYLSTPSKEIDVHNFKFHVLNLSKLCFKTIRFGFESYSPFDPLFKSNRDLIMEEIDFILNNYTSFLNIFNTDIEYIQKRIIIKKEKLLNYSFYQKEKLL